MGRTTRSNLPGTAFHLTARTQGHEPWFTETLRPRIVEYVAAAIAASDSRLLAYTIMPNHLHLVVRQGPSKLDRVMQPLLCRIALLVHRRHGLQGHVFERRFRDHPCRSPQHLRHAIVYTHLNPVRGALVQCATDWPWSSHHLYLADAHGPSCMRRVLAVDDVLGLFGIRDGSSRAELRQGYRALVVAHVRARG